MQHADRSHEPAAVSAVKFYTRETDYGPIEWARVHVDACDPPIVMEVCVEPKWTAIEERARQLEFRDDLQGVRLADPRYGGTLPFWFYRGRLARAERERRVAKLQAAAEAAAASLGLPEGEEG